MRYLDERQIKDIAIGSGVLGTGGGGNPYLGMLAAIQAIRKHGDLELYELDELPDDTLAVSPFAIGSPVPYIERVSLNDELMTAFTAMSRYFGREIGAIVSAEIGGVNSVVPLALARELGLPAIDADGMGRAYPEVDLCTFTLYGHGASPMAVADEHGNVTVIDTIDNRWVERIARPVAVEMGAIAGAVGFPITVGDLKRAAVVGTVSYAETIGRAIREAQAQHASPVDAVLNTTNGYLLFTGRIIDVQRRIERGWALGEVVIAGTDDDAGSEMVVQFQNEHLVALRDGVVMASVPDLIAILDAERGDPITTEELRYGFRVGVIAMPCDEKWRTPEGVALGGPRHFRYDIDYVPIEERMASAGTSR
ncbi:MAG: DUF917 domain-containing protein [Thermomicrobiales bacterium]|nr:DUF917 domain-containing protein [Thermomicrobiales bacterium]MCO5221552.1 DUF917 domain-containing protein [Thermomicrobiales bacterium]